MSGVLTRNQCVIYMLFILVMCVLSVLSMQLGEHATSLLLKEGGVVETASAIGYVLCVVYLYSFERTESLRSHWYLYVIFLAMTLRELDFDKRFTETGVLQSKFLFASNVNLFEKGVGLLVLMLMLGAIVKWIARHAKPFFTGVRSYRSADWATGFALAFIVLTKSIDGLARKLEPLGVQVTIGVNELASRFEEVFELGIPITFLYAIHFYWSSAYRAKNPA